MLCGRARKVLWWAFPAGVDSAVVSALCAHSGLDVLCVVLPIRQQADQLQRANEHIADLQHRFINVRSQTLDLTPTFEQFERSVADTAAANKNLAMANTRSPPAHGRAVLLRPNQRPAGGGHGQ